jgi:hypothetical protein
MSLHGWKDNIKIYFKGIGFDVGEWIHPAQERIQWRAVLNTVTDLRGNFLTS